MTNQTTGMMAPTIFFGKVGAFSYKSVLISLAPEKIKKKMDDFLKKSVNDAEKLRVELVHLRKDPSIPGMIKYNTVLLEAVERQHNMYTRLRLMGDKESKQIADEMELVAFSYMGRPKDISMSAFLADLKNEILEQLDILNVAKKEIENDIRKWEDLL